MKTKTLLGSLAGIIALGGVLLTADYSPKYRIIKRDLREDVLGLEQIIYYEKLGDVSKLFVFSEKGDLIFSRPLLQTDVGTPFGKKEEKSVTSHDYQDSKPVKPEDLMEEVRRYLAKN